MEKIRKSTMVELVAELEKLRPGLKKIGPKAEAFLEALIEEAKTGEYHDYKNRKYACGKVAVCGYLDYLTDQMVARNEYETANELSRLSREVKNGDYDETADDLDKQSMRRMLDKNGMGSKAFKDLFGL